MPTFTKEMFAEADRRAVVCFNDPTGRNTNNIRDYLNSRYLDKCSFEL